MIGNQDVDSVCAQKNNSRMASASSSSSSAPLNVEVRDTARLCVSAAFLFARGAFFS